MPSSRAPSIRTLIAAAVLAPAVVIAVLLLWIGNATSKRLAGDLGDRMLAASSQMVGLRVENFLDDAVRTGDLLARQLETGVLSAADLEAWHRPTFDLLETSPRISAITFGTAEDDAFYLQRMPYGLEECVAHGAGILDSQYLLSADGARTGVPNRVYDYRPSQRPWYVDAAENPSPHWTKVYAWFAQGNSDATTACAYVRHARDAGGRAGILCIDVTLNELSQHLRSIRPTERSSVFLIDADGKLVATSRDGGVSRDGERTTMAGSGDMLTVALGRAAGVSTNQDRMTVDVDGVAMRVMSSKLTPHAGIEWKVIAATPESDLLSEARDTRNRSILMAMIVVAAGVFFAWMTARRIAGPIVMVQQHVDRIADGDFESRIKVGGSREMLELSKDLNAMSGDLKNRVELMQSMKLATLVQQSLLPQTAPTSSRFDIHGLSTYCDQTGGDYFDFIEVAQDADGTLLIAIGDVAGHGIGSAMLMASARGALRAVLLENADLAQAMDRVNRILLQSSAGLFMTMTLMRISASSGTVTWSSAGHDPAVIYDPRTKSFRELDGAEIPLGVYAMDYLLYHADGLEQGMVLAIGTDGVWEMRNPSEEEFGKERMNAVIAANAHRTSKEIGDALEAEMFVFRKNYPVRDDVTYVIVKMK